jgi:hypothetical protein
MSYFITLLLSSPSLLPLFFPPPSPFSLTQPSFLLYKQVLLFTTQPLPIIFPYLYSTATPNKLKNWLFVNNNLEESRHQVKKFRGVE